MPAMIMQVGSLSLSAGGARIPAREDRASRRNKSFGTAVHRCTQLAEDEAWIPVSTHAPARGMRDVAAGYPLPAAVFRASVERIYIYIYIYIHGTKRERYTYTIYCVDRERSFG